MYAVYEYLPSKPKIHTSFTISDGRDSGLDGQQPCRLRPPATAIGLLQHERKTLRPAWTRTPNWPRQGGSSQRPEEKYIGGLSTRLSLTASMRVEFQLTRNHSSTLTTPCWVIAAQRYVWEREREGERKWGRWRRAVERCRRGCWLVTEHG